MNEGTYTVPPSRLSTNRVHFVMLLHAVVKLIIMQPLLKVSVYVEKCAYFPLKYVISKLLVPESPRIHCVAH
jgi:hypothetical protein